MVHISKSCLLLSSALVVMSCSTAFAQAATDQQTTGAGRIDDIVVTARKKEERLQDVPAAVVALTADQLAASGARRINDVTNLSSGVSVVPLGGAQPFISLRGDSNRNGARDTGTGLFIDNIFVASLTQFGVGLVDIARVEVLKGPQATLYGKNTLAGAINVVTADPTWQTEGEVEVGYGASSVHGETLGHAQAILSGPLVDDRVAVRLVAAYQQRDGFIYDPERKHRGAGYDSLTLRGKVWLKPFDNVDWRLTLDYRRSKSPRLDNLVPGSGTGVPLAASSAPQPKFFGSIWETTVSFQPENLARNVSMTSDLRIETGIGTVTSLTNYTSSRSRFRTDPDGSSIDVVQLDQDDKSKTFSQELRVAGKSGDLSWTAGAFYFDDDVQVRRQTQLFGPASSSFQAGTGGQVGNSPVSTETKSLFAQLGFDVTSNLNVTGGLRYSRDRKFGVVDLIALNTSGNFLRTILAPTDRSATFESVTGNIVASYRVTPETLAYLSYSTGTKAGGFAGVNNLSQARLPYDETTVKAWEAGIKTDLFDRRLRLNVALFNSDYKDLQLQRTILIGTANQTVTFNAGKQRAYGADVEMAAVLTDELRLDASYSYLHARINDYEIVPGVILNGIAPARNPAHSGYIGLTYNTDVGAGRLTLAGNMSFKSDFNNDIARLGNGRLLLAPSKGYEVFNANAAYEFENLEISAYIRNIANRQYYPAQVILVPGAYITAVPSEPRTFEVSFKVKF